MGLIEHPAEPKGPSKPSIWRLPIIRLLAQLPGFAFVDSDSAQGLLGAKSLKPTRLLALNPDTLPQSIHAHRICPDLPKTVAIGKAKSGHWATTGPKEHPPALNHALGECFAHHLMQSTVDASATLDDNFFGQVQAHARISFWEPQWPRLPK